MKLTVQISSEHSELRKLVQGSPLDPLGNGRKTVGELDDTWKNMEKYGTIGGKYGKIGGKYGKIGGNMETLGEIW